MTALAATRIDPAALAELTAALWAAKLPIADLGEPGRAFFRFDDSAGTVGFGGVEGNSADHLLRSLVVAPDRRGIGLGRAVLALLEREARQLGGARLHLLTNTAAPFFRSSGYADADRSSAPPAVSGSREFTALCPASAAYLVKAI